MEWKKCEYCNKEITKPYTITTFTHTSEGEKDIWIKAYCDVECANSATIARKEEE